MMGALGQRPLAGTDLVDDDLHHVKVERQDPPPAGHLLSLLGGAARPVMSRRMARGCNSLHVRSITTYQCIA